MAERMVAKQAPRFEMDAVLPNKEFGKVSLEENMKNDKWTVLYFYPMDFTFVCPTEITALSDRLTSLKIWMQKLLVCLRIRFTHTWPGLTHLVMKMVLGTCNTPLAADTNHQVSRDYGVLLEEEGVALRGLFIISPEGELQYSSG